VVEGNAVEDPLMANKSKPSDMANDIAGLVLEGTKKWTKIKKTEERNPPSRRYRRERMTRSKGYLAKGCGGNRFCPRLTNRSLVVARFPANARQLMYAARPHIQR